MGFAEPRPILNLAGIEPGMTVADLGAGAGAFSLEAARRVGSEGRVYAVDVNKELLAKVKADAMREQLASRIEIVWADAEAPQGTKLADLSVDMVLLCNVLFLAEDKEALAKEANRILRPGGRVLVLDWTDSFGGLGPAPQAVVARDAALALFQRQGFALSKEIPGGDHHYALILKKQ